MPKASERTAIHAIVTGRVQGVGFRYFVQREASRLGLVGWVRNLAEGNVEVLAQGEPKAVDALVAKLRQGPSLAWVQHLVATPRKPDSSLLTFEIRSTGW